MNFNRLSGFILLLVIQIMLACGTDDPAICIPVNLKSTTDSIVFEFNTSKKIDKVLYYFFELHQIDELEYDNSGRLVWVKRKKVSNGTENVYENGELIYNSEGKPQTLNAWGANTGLPPQVTTFSYDSKERLIKRETSFGSDLIVYRYEYDNHDNVINIFYTNAGNPEVLGRENLSFDSHARFFAPILDLEILSVFVYNTEPSKNNILSSTVYWDGPFTKFGAPLNITYDVRYNENGLIVNSFSITGTGQTVQEFSFHGINYDCQ